MAFLIDEGINVGNISNIYKYGAMLVVFALLALLCGVLAGKYAARASAGFAKNLRRDVFYRVQNFSFSNIDKYSTAGIVTRLTTDITNIQNAYQMIIRIADRAPLMLIFSLIMTFTINSRLAVIFLGVVPVLALGLYLIIQIGRASCRERV